MHGALAETIAIAVLVASLVVAVARPFGVSEAVVAVPGAALLVATGVVGWHPALDRLREIGPTVGFLAAILVFGHLCAEAGVFDYLGARAAQASRGRPAPVARDRRRAGRRRSRPCSPWTRRSCC